MIQVAIHPDEYRVASWLPEGRIGDWSIERFVIPPYPRETWREEGVTPGGVYTKLVGPGQHGTGDCWMHDQPNEFESFWKFIEAARGRVLVTGLGILVPAWLLQHCSEVKSVTVIELYQEVIDLVGPHLRKLPTTADLEIIQGDGGVPIKGQWDVAIHDHWPSRPEDGLIDRVFAAWGPYVKHQFAWEFASLPLRECIA